MPTSSASSRRRGRRGWRRPPTSVPRLATPGTACILPAMAERNRSQVWLAAACGAALGLAAGIFVSVTTEFPLAPEAGLLLGWAAYRIRRR